MKRTHFLGDGRQCRMGFSCTPCVPTPVSGPSSSRSIRPRRRGAARAGVRIAGRRCTARRTRPSPTVWLRNSEPMPDGTACAVAVAGVVSRRPRRFLWPAFPRGAAVRDGERAGARRRRAVGIDQPQMGDSSAHAEPLAAVVARDVCADPVVALETGRVGDGARGGAAADTAASHSRPRGALAAVARPDMASSVDGLLRARRWPDATRRECF